MISAGLDERIYLVNRLAGIVDALAREGVPTGAALRSVKLPERALRNPATRVSLAQMIRVCANAIALSRDPHFAYHAGLRFHVSSFGIFGFAILSSRSMRQAIDFTVRYATLSSPLLGLSFREEQKHGIWALVPMPHLSIDPAVLRFLFELELGVLISCQRDLLGSSFAPKEIRLSFVPPRDAQIYPGMFGCRVLFDQPETQLIFDVAWLDSKLQFANELAHAEMAKLCDNLMEELKLRVGIAGKVRELLLMKGLRPQSFESVATQVHMTGRTLRRKLRNEGTSFRKILDDLRMHVAVNYLRDTLLTISEISLSLGFSDDAAFRHAFRRWTKSSPLEFRRHLKSQARADQFGKIAGTRA